MREANGPAVTTPRISERSKDMNNRTIRKHGRTQTEMDHMLYELKRTYRYLEESDMDPNDAADARHLHAVRRALEFIEDIMQEG